jgi:alpha-1,2-mannosyltransferase
MTALDQSKAPTAAGDPYRAYRLAGNAFATIILMASVAELVWNIRHPTVRDFLGFWSAAQLALAGHPAAAYDNAALHAVQSAVALGTAKLPFSYPPAYLLLVMPFGLLPFATGMIAWSLSTLAFYVSAARRLFPQSGWLAVAFPAVFANARMGQNACVTAGIFMGGLALLESSPFAAGAVLGCLVIKPQLALLLPVAMIAGRQWRAIAGAAVSSTGIMVLGFVLFGPKATTAWIHQLPLIATVARDGLVGWSKLGSVYAATRQAGLASGPAILLHGLVLAAAAAAVWRIWRSNCDYGAKFAILSAATLLASPYVFFYDGVILVPAFLWLARENTRPGVLLALWCLPLVMLAEIAALDGAGVNLNPVLPIALGVLVYRRWRSGNAPSEQAESSSLTLQQPSPVTLS